MKDYESWALCYKYYEQLRVMVDKNDSRLWSQGSSFYEQLRVVYNMGYS